MGQFAIGIVTKTFAWLIAGVIVILNVKLVISQLTGWMEVSVLTKHLILFTVVPVSIALGILLVFITVRPLVGRILFKSIRSPHITPILGDITSKDNLFKNCNCNRLIQSRY